MIISDLEYWVATLFLEVNAFRDYRDPIDRSNVGYALEELRHELAWRAELDELRRLVHG